MTSRRPSARSTKLEFAYGLATRMAELIGDAVARRRTEMLGELACYVEVDPQRGRAVAEQGWDAGDGVWFPDGARSQPMRSMLPIWIPRVNEIITLIGSHNLLTTPSRAPARRRRRCGR